MLPVIAKKIGSKKLLSFKPSKAFKIAVVVITIIIATKITFGKQIKSWFAKDTSDTAGDEVDKSNLSYTKTQYKSHADALEAAMDTCGARETDESAIYAVIEDMNNIDDILQLIAAFGKRKWVPFICFGGKMAGLSQWLTLELSKREMRKLNAIIEEKGINFKF